MRFAIAVSVAASAAAVALAPALAGTAGRSSIAAPEAADQTLGMALMSASVYWDGNVLDGAGVVDAVKANTGEYHVTFVREIYGCIPVATPRQFSTVLTVSIRNEPGQVRVVAQNLSGTNIDAEFYLLVFCAK